MNEKEIIVLKGVSKVYQASNGIVHAVNDVDLSVLSGEFLAVMGRSGSGKSTLLQIIGTLQQPSKGEYFLNGKRVDQMKETEILALRRREIGFVFQHYQLLRAYTVWENICMPLALDHVPADIAYLETLAERCGIADKLDEYPDQLSGGQQQRVAIVRGMAHKPSVLLADEPTGNLDYKTGMQIMQVILDCRREFGQTVVMVTHDNECADYADRVIHLEDGRLIAGMM